MKIAITNTALLNTGDAAILMATIQILRNAFGPSLDFVVYDQQASIATRYYPDLDIRPLFYDQLSRPSGKIGRKIEAVRLLAAAIMWRSPIRCLARGLAPSRARDGLAEMAGVDLVVSAGGTYLVPHYRTFPKLFDLLIASALGRPLVLFTQSLGPFAGRNNRLLHFVLRRAELILVRDARSRSHLVDFGIRVDRIVECADAAFALAAPSVRGRIANPLRIAISVRDWPHLSGDKAGGMERYFDAVGQVALRLVEEKGAEVTFVSTCQGIPEYWTDDSKAAEEVVDRLPKNVRCHVKIQREFHDPVSLIEVLKTFDLVVATRMHIAILALGAGVPVVPIAYEFKMVELFSRLGLDVAVQDIESVTAESLYPIVEGLLSRKDDIRPLLASKVERERQSAISAGRHVSLVLESV